MSSLNISDVFSKIEKASEAWSLTPRETNTLRLLGEEMVGMTGSLAQVDEYDFFVKSEEKNFELHLVARAKITPAQKRTFVQTSSQKKNQMTKGLTGKMKSLFEELCCKGWMSNPLLKQQDSQIIRSRMKRFQGKGCRHRINRQAA